MKILFLVSLILITSKALSQTLKNNERIIFKYRKYEKFDFEDLVIEGETGSPGDLSIIPRYQRKFKNRLPYRTEFNDFIKKSIERTR